jgi:hypothetical protein
MFGFKSFLVEYLTDEQRRKYAAHKMSAKARSATDSFFGKDNDTVHGEIQNDDKSEIHRKIEQHLGHDISHDDYVRGAVKDKYNRDVRLGRVIKNNSLRDQFDRDPVRQTGYRNHKTTTVRGIEVAGQTNPVPNEQHPNGHAWKDSSCKNISNGINRRYLKHEIKHGTVVHFVHDHNGQEIYRATLQPHHNGNEHTMYTVDAEYGIKHPKFTEDAHRVAERLSGEYQPGLYAKHLQVYDDNRQRIALHPKTSRKHIGDIVNNFDIHPESIRRYVTNLPTFTSSHITKILKTGSKDSRAIALSNPEKITPQHISMALQDPHAPVRAAALKSRHATESHLMKAVRDPNITVAREAIAHLNANEKVWRAGIRHPDTLVSAGSLSRMHTATPKDIDTVLNRPKAVDSPAIVDAVRRHPSTLPRHIDKIASDSTDSYAIANAIQHRSTTPETLARVMTRKGDDFTAAREAVVKHEKATPEMIKSARTDPSWPVREAAYAHPSTTTAELHNGFDNEPSSVSRVREAIVSHKNADKDLLTKALTTKYDHHFDENRIHEKALKHRKADESHVTLALNHPNYLTRINAVKHRKATLEQLENAYKNDDSYRVQNVALNALSKKRGESQYATYQHYNKKS